MPHNGGRAQINVSKMGGAYDTPYINQLKHSRDFWQAESASEDWRLLYDSRCYPTRMPAGSGAVWRLNVFVNAPTGSTLVLDWPGTASLALTAVSEGLVLSESVISANRKEYTVTSSQALVESDGSERGYQTVKITISSMSANTFSGGTIRLYKKSLESQIANVFDPGYFARVGSLGVIRFVDNMLLFGADCNEALHSQRKPADSFSYFAPRVDSTLWCGESTGTNDQIVSAPSASFGSWTDGQIVQWFMTSQPAFRVPTGCTNANPGAFEDVGHPYLTGDKVEFNPGFSGTAWDHITGSDLLGGNGGAFRALTVTKLDADHYSLGINTTTFGAYPGGLRIYKQITCKVGALSAIPCCFLQGGVSNFYSSTFSNGMYLVGTYDATLGRLLVTLGSLLEGPAPVETIMDLANRGRAHPWLTMGMLWSDDRVTQFATNVRDLQPSWMIPRYEYANEVWNFGTWLFAYSAARGALDSQIADYDYHQYYGKRVSQISDLISAVYDGSGKQFKMAMAVQAAAMNSGNTTNRFKALAVSGGNSALYPINKCDILAFAGYWGPALDGGSAAANFPGYVNAIYNYKQGGALRTAAFDWFAAHCESNTADATFRQNSHAYSVGDLITIPSSIGSDIDSLNLIWGYVYSCTTAGTSAGSIPVGYTSLSDVVTDGTAVFQAWSGQPINYVKNVQLPFWKGQADLYTGRTGGGVEAHHYEGGIGFAGPDSIGDGFPTTHSGSGSTISDSDQRAFLYAFMESRQHATIIVRQLQNHVDGGGLFPSHYLAAEPWTQSTVWGLQRNNMFDGVQTQAFTDFLEWNSPSEPEPEEATTTRATPDPFSADDLANLRHHQDELKKATQRRSKSKREHQARLRDAVEEIYDKLSGIAPAAAAKVAAVIPAKAKITETAARSDTETPAIDWSKVTAAQISKVIATMDAYAAQLEAEQRQQAMARADAARQRDEDDIEALLMAL